MDNSSQESLFYIRNLLPADEPFIVDSWVEANRETARAQDAGSVYYAEQKALVRDLISRPTVTTRVAHVPDDVDAILGWCVFDFGPKTVVHYVYVKRNARKLGVARALLEQLIPLDCYYSHRPVYASMFNSIPKNWTFNPYKAK